ncbi:hypothetical protein [Jiella pelagia]|uniref:Uncharacterized protein n=1 Tax=Jiella pelagia TaxID=2986949 RepID=A0ABY7C0U1_9HYPH|nr:hypothetical protein [Jiella pelagia]WAP69474.1 hypothetical protein OH818_04230 [Jiella pelagia]
MAIAATLVGDLALTDTVYDSGSLGLNGASGVHALTIGGRNFVYVAGRADDAVTVFELDASGQLAFRQTFSDTSTTALAGAANITSVTLPGGTYLYVNASDDSGISVFQVAANGSLSLVEAVYDDATLELAGTAGKMSVAHVGNANFLIASGYDDGGASVFRINADGTLTNTGNVDDASNADFALRGTQDVASVTSNGETFVFVAASLDSGITGFKLDANGGLTFTDSLFDSTNLLSQVVALAAHEIDGQAYLFAASPYEGLNVFRVSASGELQAVFYLRDYTIDGLRGPCALTVFELEGSTFLAVSSRTGNGVTLFSVNNDGSLYRQSTIIDDASTALDGSFSNDVVMIGDTQYLVASGPDEDGVSVFGLGLGPDTLEGSFTSQTLLGFDGDDVLIGGGGSDLLIGGQGADRLDGGAWLDTASYKDSATGVIVNLAIGRGAFGDAAGDTLINIEHVNGSRFADVLTGDDGINILRGGAGNDIIRGYAENDLLFGGDGSDTIFGGDGKDRINGEAGHDRLSGGMGTDTVFGHLGDDVIIGDADGTADTYNGEVGNDAIDYSAVTTAIDVNFANGVATGSAIGRDSLAGFERVFAGSGNDSLVANAETFLMDGGAGNDTMLGSSGANILVGGLGNDILNGFDGYDRLNGGAGDDRLAGGGNNDVFIFADGFGTDVVVDFNEFSSAEKIDLSAVTAITSFADLAANHLTQVGADAVITDGANTITLNGVLIADLDANDFLF